MDGSAIDSGVPHGRVLTAFVDAVLAALDGQEDVTLAAARQAVRDELGDAAFVDVCATIASFDAVVKLADGTGIPLEAAKAERTADIREALAIDALRK